MDMIKQFSTMCNHYQSTDDGCRDCPLRSKIEDNQTTCHTYMLEHPDDVSKVVQEWFYSTFRVLDLIDRTTLLQALRSRWASSSTASKDALIYIDIEELIKDQLKVLPPSPQQDSTALVHSVDDDKSAKSIMTFRQDFVNKVPSCPQDANGYPTVSACKVYSELNNCWSNCRTVTCEACWNTPMLPMCIESRARDLAKEQAQD